MALNKSENTWGFFLKSRALQKAELSQIPAWNTRLFKDRHSAEKRVRGNSFSTGLISLGDFAVAQTVREGQEADGAESDQVFLDTAKESQIL